MSDFSDQPLWRQFRRLFVGTLVDAITAAGITASSESLRVEFSDKSVFKVPRFDNFMRFIGEASATVDRSPDEGALTTLNGELAEAWPGLVGVVKIPIGDKLTVEKNEIDVTVVALPDGRSRLVVKFNLEAD